MIMSFGFILLSVGLGVGLAVDAFSVSLANGLNEPNMKRSKALTVAGVFAVFQGVMPLIGWVLVHTLLTYFTAFETLIPWIALALLGFIGGKMLYEGIRDRKEPCEACDPDVPAVSLAGLIVQGIATSIDALSVGFTISEYNWIEALVCGLLIAVVTFGICMGGLFIGKKFGTKLAGSAGILGGSILIFIGLEIFITGVFA